ncbi:hypothetical protein [Metabacillus litoralis]|uniref:hypothetical protein n=1 Tax=Metabacillus litoralis TaxID=152268 RepID=UPI00203E4BBC|nr:hypothetical protein [Metabacillus litoralis]
MKWFKITSLLLLIFLVTACNNNEEDLITNKNKQVSDEVESKDSELDSNPSNTLTE